MFEETAKMSAKSGFKGEYLRRLPAVGRLLEYPQLIEILDTCPRVLLVQSIQEILDFYKSCILSADDESRIRDIDLSIEHILSEVVDLARQRSQMGLRRAINATGDTLNDDMGRAPMNKVAQEAVADVAAGYCTLAVDGDRDRHVQELLSILTGAEAGLIVNNNAAAVMLIFNTIADGKEVIVSRGQLIESDGFRLPEIIAKSGAQMVSVGATNKSRPSDYRNAITGNTGAILRAHRSNFRIAGFSQDVPLQELLEIGGGFGVPVVDDIGTGCLVDVGMSGEPVASLSIRNGVDIVCFSGDKLLSGSQAGIILGADEYVSAMKKNPLYRALRAGKLTLASLEATLRSHLDAGKIPDTDTVMRLLSRSAEKLESMTRFLADSLTEKLSDEAAVSWKKVILRHNSFPTQMASYR